MKLQEILRTKGSNVLTIQPDATLEDVVQKLVKYNCGSLVVCVEEQAPEILGIITERDILRACAHHKAPLVQLLVREVMTTEMVTGAPSDSLEDIMGLMTNHRIRHLPILEERELRGIISIGDIVKAQHDQLTMENHYLKGYIQGDSDVLGGSAIMSRPR